MTILYSDAYTILNLGLEATGLKRLAKIEYYTDLTKQDKYQRQGIIWLDLLQRQAAVTLNKRFMYRQFEFSTTAYPVTGQTTYVLNRQIIEGLKANSFFNVSASGLYNSGHIKVLGYERWRELNPDPNNFPTGVPQYIIVLPDDGSGDTRVMIWPFPDAVYTIEGQCRRLVSPITSGSDKIVFPQMYEHVLVFKLCALLESKMNEGREMSMLTLASEALQEVLRDATGANEESTPVDLGFTLWGGEGRRTVRDYNPATDIPDELT